MGLQVLIPCLTIIRKWNEDFVMRVLVVGAGSIGTRHQNNLNELGVETTTVDPKGSEYPSIGDAVHYFHPDAAIVAVPTYLHMEVAVELARHNMPLFIEKPVSHNMDELVTLQHNLGYLKQWAVVGYSMRFHPAIQIIKDLLPQIGTPLYARAEVGQYLPDWHPEEDYRNWYMAHEDQGGGALLDLSHEIDYMRWLFGDSIKPFGIVGNHTKETLEIDSDSIAEFMDFFGETLVSIHMDLLDRSYNRRLRIVGSEGTISWDTNQIYIELHALEGVRNYGYDKDRNIQFKEEMKAFVESVQSGIVHPTLATLEDGIETLKICLELKKQNGR